MHRQQAKDNGLLDVAELDILDEEGSMEIPIEGGVRIEAPFSYSADSSSIVLHDSNFIL